VAARHAKAGREPREHLRFEFPRRGRGRRMQQVLVQRRVPQRRGPGDPRRRRIHVRECGRVVQPSCTAEHDRCQQVERLPGSEPRVWQPLRQVDRGGIRAVAAQQRERVKQSVVAGKEVAIHARALLRGKTSRVYSAGRWPYHCARFRETEGGLHRADLRIRLSRLRSPLRDAGALGRDARLPELSLRQPGQAALGVRHAGGERGGAADAGAADAGALRFLRSPGRAGQLRVRLTSSPRS